MPLIKVHQYDRAFSLIPYALVTFMVYPFLFWGLRWLLQYFPDAWYWGHLAERFEIAGIGFNIIDGFLFLVGLFGFLLGQVEHRETGWQNGGVMDCNSKTPLELKTDGWYSRVRHPMYQFFIVVSSSLLVTTRSLWGMSIALMLLGMHWLVIGIEEKELKSRFGIAYLQYKQEVPAQFFTRFWAVYMVILYGLVIPGMF